MAIKSSEMERFTNIREAYERMSQLKANFRYWQLGTENIKKRIYDPYETELDRHQWEMHNQYEILDNRCVLKNLENEIKEVRKIIKQMNREQNKQYEMTYNHDNK